MITLSTVPPQTVSPVTPICWGNVCDKMIQTFPVHPMGTQESFLYRKSKRFLRNVGNVQKIPLADVKKVSSFLLDVTTLESIGIRLITHEIKNLDVKLIRNPIHIPT